MASKISFKYDDKRLKVNLNTLDPKIRAMLPILAEYEAAYATAWLKINARWTDRTGAARSGLVAIPEFRSDMIGLTMAYSVHYGIWLEVAHNRKYEIIQTAMRVIGQKMLDDLNNLLSRVT